MKKTHALQTISLALCGMAAHSQAVAPTPGEAGDKDVVGEIIVTAQKREEKLKDVPLTVTALPASQLANSLIDDTRGLEQAVPGLVFTSQGAWAEPNLRGISTGNSGPGEESPIAIYVDGVYQVSQVASLFQLPDVAQVEVLKGPQGTLFGRNAEGGAIQIQTKDPTFIPTVDVSASLGYYTGNGASRSSPEYSTNGFVAVPIIKDVLAASVSFYLKNTDGYLDNIATGRRDGSINTQIFRAKLLFTPTDNLKFLVSGWYSENRDNANNAPAALNGASEIGAVDPATNLPFYPGGIVPSRPWTTAHDYPTYIRTETYGASIKGTLTTDAGTLTSFTALNDVKNGIRVDVQAAYLPPGPERTACYSTFTCIDYQVTQPAQSVSEELDWASRNYGPFSYVAGLFLFRSDEHQGAYINQEALPLFFDNDFRVVSKSAAVFLEGNYAATDRLTFILGGRYSYEKKIGTFQAAVDTPYEQTAAPHWEAFTPRASVRYSLDNLSNVYFTYSQGFKSGVINDGAPFNIVEPESLRAYEVGYKRNTSIYSFDAAAFYYDYKNVQVESFSGTQLSTNNAASASIYGVDLDGSVRVTSDFEMRLAASYLPVAKYDRYDNVSFHTYPLGPAGFASGGGSASGERLLKTPKVTATLSGTYTKDLSWATLETSASLYYGGSFYWETGYRVQTAAHAVANAQIALTPAKTKLKIALWGKNLTNTAYVQGIVGGSSADMAVFNPPREIGITVGYRY